MRIGTCLKLAVNLVVCCRRFCYSTGPVLTLRPICSTHLAFTSVHLLVRAMRPTVTKVAHSRRVSSGVVPPSQQCQRTTNPQRPQQLKTWSEEDMTHAVEAVKDKKCTIREAAATYNLPRSTIGDRVSGRTQMGAKSGPPTYLTPHEEKELVDFLIGCAQIGFARTRKQVMNLVQATMAKKGKENAAVTNGWWDSFMKRHPELALRTPEKLAYVRAIMGNKEVIEAYFDLLEETLIENGLLHKPGAIFNVDETGIPLEHKPEKAITKKGAKNVTAHTSGDKTNITVIACGSAAGQIIPPMVLFQGKKLNHNFTIGEIPGTMYGMGSGWVDTELFEAWFTDHFLVYAPKTRPLLLLLDGHVSHYQPEVVRFAAKESVILFCFPPHCTHLAQPLDKGAFSPLKTYWHQECARFMEKNPGEIVSKRNFSTIFAKAWYRAMTPKTMTASFRATGVYSFNREAIQVPEVSKPDSAQVDKGVITYLPLYSPTPKRSGTRTPASVTTPPFSESEQELFKIRQENGYDITTDHRYNQWLLQNTMKESEDNLVPQLSHTSVDNEVLKCTAVTPPVTHPATIPTEPSSLSEFLQIPELPSALKKNEKRFRTARVLTSDVAIQEMEEKERKKKEEADRKEWRRKEREERARVKAEQQAEKKRKAEEKKKEKERAQRERDRVQHEQNKTERGNVRRKPVQIEKNKDQTLKRGMLREEIEPLTVDSHEDSETEDENDTLCSLGECSHTRATTWVCCNLCKGWWHCICANVSRKHAAKDDYIFTCCNC